MPIKTKEQARKEFEKKSEELYEKYIEETYGKKVKPRERLKYTDKDVERILFLLEGQTVKVEEKVDGKLLREKHFICSFCGKIGQETVDHILPRVLYRMFGLRGENPPENLQAMCKKCNGAKGYSILQDDLTKERLKEFIGKIEQRYNL